MNIEISQSGQWPYGNLKNLSPAKPQADELSPEQPPVAKQRDPNAEFYSRVESPWLPKTSAGATHPLYEGLSENRFKQLRDAYLEDSHEKAAENLRHIFDSYCSFKEQLSYINPELAKKHFGFTLGFDQQIKVTDPDGILTPHEVSYLTEQLNNRSKLQDNVRAHARGLMELNDHDRKNFPDRRKINLENYSKIIDYGQLFSRNTIGSFIKVLSYQLERNAEKVEEKKPESLIDVRA
jgi:hypothetical protein